MFLDRENSKKSWLQFIGILFIGCTLLMQCTDSGDSSSTSSNPETHTVTGTVNNTTGNPIFEANVSIVDGDQEIAETTTNTEGEFEMTEISEGDFELVVSSSGYNDYSSSITIDGETTQEVELLGDATISGKVIDWADETALENVQVKFSSGATIAEADTSNPNLTATTDENGNFTIEDAPTGTFVCVIYFDGYITEIVEELSFEEGNNDLGQSIISEAFSYSGSIANSTDNPVLDAELKLMEGDTEIATTTVDPTGSFEFTSVPGGTFELIITGSGYNDINQSVTIDDDITEQLFELLGNSTISGRVLDSQSASGLANANVEFSPGATITEADTSKPEITTITDADGYYSIEQAPSGVYVCVITADNYEPQVVEEVDLSDGSNDLGESTAVEEVDPTTETELNEANYEEAVEAQGPDDLDTHMTGPVSDGSSERFHVFYADQTPVSEVELDVDDISSYGPETTTITQTFNGTYRYSVHNYANQNEDGAIGIKESPAEVEVYDSSGQIAVYNPPEATSTSGNTWRVFEMEVTDGEISLSELGNYEQVSDEYDGSQFQIPATGKKGFYDVSDF